MVTLHQQQILSLSSDSEKGNGAVWGYGLHRGSLMVFSEGEGSKITGINVEIFHLAFFQGGQSEGEHSGSGAIAQVAGLFGSIPIHIQKSLVHIGRPGFRDKQTAVGHSGGKSSPRRIAEFRHGIGALRLENKAAMPPQEAVGRSLGAFQCDGILLLLVTAGVKGGGQKAGGKGEFFGVREEGQTGGVLRRGKDILLPRMDKAAESSGFWASLGAVNRHRAASRQTVAPRKAQRTAGFW